MPAGLLATYLYGFASDQYESGADFVIRRADASSSGAGDVGQLLGFNFGASSTLSEAYLVEDYLLSHDVVARLQREDNLVAVFRRPGIDWISRLWSAQPEPERLLSYYRNKITIEQDTETGITHLQVHAFSPADAHRVASKLLHLGEERINALNARTIHDQVATAGHQLQEAESALLKVQSKLNSYRRVREDIDPEGTGKAQISLVTTLTGQLVAARARMKAMEGVISPDSPQYIALRRQVRALESQVAGQSARIAGQDQSTATALGGYEDLVLRREYAAKRYAMVSQQYEQAKAEANRKQLYLVRVVDANMPVRSLFPERGKIVLTVLFGLLLTYGIGSLLLAGVKEHHR